MLRGNDLGWLGFPTKVILMQGSCKKTGKTREANHINRAESVD